MKRSEQFDLVTAAMFRVKAIINTLPLVKDKQGDKAKYLQLPTLLAALEPVLLMNDLMMLQGTTDKVTDGVLVAITMETTVLHLSGQWYSEEVIIPVAGSIISKKDGGGRNPIGAQDGGISITYSRRYGILSFWGISVDEDTDGATKNQSRRARATSVAEGIIERTADRTDKLRDKLDAVKDGRKPQLVTGEQCYLCNAAQGLPHRVDCDNAFPDPKAGKAARATGTAGRS